MIDMDHCTFPNPCEDGWWIEDLQLLNSNKDEITAGGWISAPVINSGQFILAKQFSTPLKGSGFQDVGYGLVMNFYIEKERFIQILHDYSGHWLTISNVGTEKPHIVRIYDSLYSSCSLNVQQQIACLLNTDMPNITLEFVTVHKQHGSDDCGLFSLAYATALCYNEQPGNYVFDQAKLRYHLISCLENKMFSMFPFKSYRRQAMKIQFKQTIRVFCVCRMPQIPDITMISCSNKNASMVRCALALYHMIQGNKRKQGGSVLFALDNWFL